MRLIRLAVPETRRSTALEILDGEDIDYVLVATDRTDGERTLVEFSLPSATTPTPTSTAERTLVEFPLPAQAVGQVLGGVEDAGIDVDEYTVVVNMETARTRHFDDLERRFVDGSEQDDSVARDEIRSTARDMHRVRPPTTR